MTKMTAPPPVPAFPDGDDDSHSQLQPCLMTTSPALPNDDGHPQPQHHPMTIATVGILFIIFNSFSLIQFDN